MAKNLDDLAAAVRSFHLCVDHRPLGPCPVLSGLPTVRLLIAGQAPGTKVRESGISWSDASGDRLREWLDLPKSIFHDDTKVAIIPQAFCCPGRESNGDLPPPPICQKTWRPRLHAAVPQVETFVPAGRYAQAYHFGDVGKRTLRETVSAWQEYCPRHFPVPHPSWRNNHWLKVNAWFERDLVPALRKRARELLDLA